MSNQFGLYEPSQPVLFSGVSIVNQFKGFVLAVERLAAVTLSSREFKEREKVAVADLMTAASEATSVAECKAAFSSAYRVLGAPGDFGYDSPEGQAMQGVYQAWNKALQEAREAAATTAVDRVALGM